MKFKVDGPNQLVSFLGTIIGIFIALNLDERIDERETEARVEAFRKLLDEEISANVVALDTFVAQCSVHEAQIRFLLEHRIAKGVITCQKSELDSAMLRWRSNPFIGTVEQQGEKRFKVNYIVKIFETSMQRTVWESFRNTDLINALSGEEITSFTQQYGNFAIVERLTTEGRKQLTHLLMERQGDPVLAKLTEAEYLQRVVDILNQQFSSISNIADSMRRGKVG